MDTSAKKLSHISERQKICQYGFTIHLNTFVFVHGNPPSTFKSVRLTDLSIFIII